MTGNMLEIIMDNAIIKKFGQDTYRVFNNCEYEYCDLTQIKNNDLIYMRNITIDNTHDAFYDHKFHKVTGSYYHDEVVKYDSKDTNITEAFDHIGNGLKVKCKDISFDPHMLIMNHNDTHWEYDHVNITCNLI